MGKEYIELADRVFSLEIVVHQEGLPSDLNIRQESGQPLTREEATQLVAVLAEVIVSMGGKVAGWNIIGPPEDTTS